MRGTGVLPKDERLTCNNCASTKVIEFEPAKENGRRCIVISVSRLRDGIPKADVLEGVNIRRTMVLAVID